MKYIKLPFAAVLSINVIAIGFGRYYDNNLMLAIAAIVLLLELCILLLANPINEADEWLAFKFKRLRIKLARNPNKKPKYDQREQQYREEADRRICTLKPLATTLNVTVVFGTFSNMFLGLIHIISP